MGPTVTIVTEGSEGGLLNLNDASSKSGESLLHIMFSVNLWALNSLNLEEKWNEML